MVPRTLAAAVASLAAVAVLHGHARPADAVGGFDPAGLLDAPQRARLDSGMAIVDVLPADGRDIAVFGTARTSIDGDRLVAWVRQVAELQRGPYVAQVARFSNPPRLSDLSAFVIGDGDLNDLRRCRPANCGLRLSADEIARVQHAVATAGREWRRAAQDEFTQVLLRRASAYARSGHASIPPTADDDSAERFAPEFTALVSGIAPHRIWSGDLTSYLQYYPHIEDDGVESLLYWSQEHLGAGKPITSITHAVIVRSSNPDRPDALIASQQVFASHYLSASLSVTAVTHPDSRHDRYLVYLRRSRADVLEGTFGGVMRQIVEQRIRADGPATLARLRSRLESGAPPHASGEVETEVPSDDAD